MSHIVNFSQNHSKLSHVEQSHVKSLPLLPRSLKTFDRYFIDVLTCFALVFMVAVYSPVSFAEEKTPTSPSLSVTEKTNINTATSEQISAALNGVGSKKAEAIVAWREKNGKFTAVEQLTEVKGIGDAIVEKNRALISL